MIGYLKGSVLDADPRMGAILILTQDVGYKIQVNTELLSKLQKGQAVALFIHTAVREDDISLYGFEKKEELLFYEQLIGISGVGPKMALEILNTPMHITQSAILSEDTGLLVKIKGVGSKTAQRIIIELKNKIVPTQLNITTSLAPKVNEEVMMALESLGYERMEIAKQLAKLPAEIKGAEATIRHFLKTK